MKDTRAALVDRLPARLKALAALAYDMRWSWNPDGRALWARVAASGGEDLSEGRPLNPVELLLSLTKSQLRALAADRDFRDLLGRVRQSLAVTVTRAKQPAGQISARRPIAYLSMEFAIDSSIPMYSGGLGILAGDHFKSASDLGMRGGPEARRPRAAGAPTAVKLRIPQTKALRSPVGQDSRCQSSSSWKSGWRAITKPASNAPVGPRGSSLSGGSGIPRQDQICGTSRQGHYPGS